jgi:hypothetical protein
MDGPRDYLVGLSQLHEIDGVDERRRVWRQGLASLAVAASNQRAAPLEVLRPELLLASIRVAFSTGLVDDVQWMSRGLAAAAFFEIAAVLPVGEEKRELGRRVLDQLLTGDAATFVLLATSLASTSRRGLSTPPVRSRVALAMRLPIGLETGVDRLALALLCRPDLEREWLSLPSSGALPARRVSSRLLERAAREAARRGLEGDDLGVKTFRRVGVRSAFRRLLADRDTLVWRHAAAARGLLAAVEPALDQEIERGLLRELGPTDWRRAATSLGASVAHSPTRRVSRCQELLQGELLTRDRGLGAALIFGLGRAAAVEPEAAEALLSQLLESGELESIEAFADLLGEHPGWRLAGRATAIALEKLRGPALADGDPRGQDDGWVGLRRALDNELSPLGNKQRPSLRQHMVSAQLAFVEGRVMHPHVEAALGTAGLSMSLLERLREDSPEDRQRGFQILRELDRGLLESSLVADLLVVSGMDPTSRTPGELGDLLVRLRSWLLARESAPLSPGALVHSELHRRRLRALVHAIDGEGFAMWDESIIGTRERRLRALDRLLVRLGEEPPSPLRRPVCAALARVCEGLVRDEVAEIGELVLLLGARLERPEDFIVLSEATVAPELREVLTAVGTLARRLREPPDGESTSLVSALGLLADSIPPGLTAPVEALRRSLLTTTRILERVGLARSLLGLTVGRGTGWLDLLGECVQDLAELSAGVWRRLNQPQGVVSSIVGAKPLRELDAAVAHAARGMASAELDRVVRVAVAGVRSDLPRMIGEVVIRTLSRLSDLPGASQEEDLAAAPREAEFLLPTWLPPSRVLGGFYVQRPIGRGTAGSVFVVCRAEERHDPGAERFALKIPSYDGSVARMLSEEEFLRLFREEAGALLTLPAHPNLAGFVTFDARARPKPILVMELVEGPTIERVLARRDLTFPTAFAILDGVASGLQKMHAIGIGHLDLKPANVILRAVDVPPDSAALHLSTATLPAVLVDFGLAGRKVRAGCASPFYGAPEVWVNEGTGTTAEPAPADVYSFCCLAYELFVGRRLFQGDTLPAVVAAHFAHDGAPPALGALRADRRFSPLADVLAAGLRADPRRRVAITDIRAELARVEPLLRQESWPLGEDLAA